MDLNDTDKQRIIKFYKGKLERYGTNSQKSLDWISLRDQVVRFSTLCNIGDLNGSSILDVGCGLGDLYGFLQANLKDFSYLGIDIAPELVIAAREKYPSGNFEIKNLSNLTKKFDYVLASGALTYMVNNYKAFYFEMIKEMFNLANIGVAFNMLDNDYYESNSVYATYECTEISKWCKKITNNYEIRVGYQEGDFSIYLKK